MGGTTVSVDEMCSLYNSQGCTYPSEELSGGGASDIDTFCNIIVEEANAENVRNRSVHLHIPDSGNLWRRRL